MKGTFISSGSTTRRSIGLKVSDNVVIFVITIW